MADRVKIQQLSQTLEMTSSDLVKRGAPGVRGRRDHHLERGWALEMDSWGQLESLRRLLCERDPALPLPEKLLDEIDGVISHKNSHALLTSSTSIAPRVIVNHSSNQRTNLSLWKGDITTLTEVTAIVNAANSALLGCFQPSHRCIDNVIHSAAGPRLRQACHKLMIEQGHEEPVGRAKVTPGFNLPAAHVIHTVGPQLTRNHVLGPKHKNLLKECYIACLEAAESLPALPDGRKVIAFCCISTGLFAFPPEVAACIAVETVLQWVFQHPETTLTDVIFDVYLQSDYDIYSEKLCSLPVTNDCSKVVKPAATTQPPGPIVSPAIESARTWLQEADYLIISAGAGLSAATGLDYASPDLFALYFPAFRLLGLRRLYDVFGFTGWKSQAQKWGYYFNHLNMVQTWPTSPLYATLSKIASRFGRRCFIRTSNADGLFVANGFHPSRISTPQGQYAYLQCLTKCRREAVFPSAAFLEAALPFLDPTTQILTDETKIPTCKYCSGELTLCVRGGDYFNSQPFRAQEWEYARFVERITSEMQWSIPTKKAPSAKAVILELGVGLNTPSVLRWPNEELVEGAPNRGMRLIRVGLDAAGCAPWELEEDGVAVGIHGEINTVVDMLATQD